MSKPRRTRPSPDKELFGVAHLYYEAGASKTEIAKRIGVSVTHVARLLKTALSRGMVQISVSAPRHLALEQEISRKFGLRDARVVSALRDEAELRRHLGREGATVFMEVARPGTRIGIGSGRTMYELAASLPTSPSAIEIFPLALIADLSQEVRSLDAMTLVNTLWFKFSPDARARKLSMAFPPVPLETVRTLRDHLFPSSFLTELQRYISAADALFFSASHPRKDSQILDITSALGFGVRELADRGVVGDYIFRPVDATGAPVDVGVEPFIIGAGLDMLKRLAHARDKAVVLVAGGVEKTDVILAGLTAGYFNILVTDDETASQLVRHAPWAAQRREREYQ